MSCCWMLRQRFSLTVTGGKFSLNSLKQIKYNLVFSSNILVLWSLVTELKYGSSVYTFKASGPVWSGLLNYEEKSELYSNHPF